MYNIDGQIVKPWLVGEGGYALQSWMITFYPGRELRNDKLGFNNAQSSTRMIVEQIFGRFKARFRWLARTMQAEDSGRHSDVVTVAAQLHNIMMDQDDRP